MNKKIGSALVFLLLLGAGCATTSNLYPGAGHKFTAQAPSYDHVWNAALRSLHDDMQIEEANKASGVIRATKPPFMGSMGEAVAVFINPQASGTYPIEIVVKNNLNGALRSLNSNDPTEVLAERIKKNLQTSAPKML